MDKAYASPAAAIDDIPDGAVIAFGGFFSAGRPTALTRALAKKGIRDLTVVVQQVGTGNEEMLELVTNGQIKRAICNYPFPRSASKGAQHPFEQAVRKGQIELEIYPIGTFVEKLRCAGAGIPAFYTPAGVGTVVAEGKEARVFNGMEYLLELALPVDFAFVHAWKGDHEGNLVYRFTAQNYKTPWPWQGRSPLQRWRRWLKQGNSTPISYIRPAYS